jgi:hypothetical protein
VQANNLTGDQAKERPMQAILMGPLIPDPNLDLEEDEHIHHPS